MPGKRRQNGLPKPAVMKDLVLAAVRELGGRAYFRAINDHVEATLKAKGISSRAMRRRVKGFPIYRLNAICSRTRTALRKEGNLIRVGGMKGGWSIPGKDKETTMPMLRKVKSNDVRRRSRRNQRRQTVNSLAESAGISMIAVKFLLDNAVPRDVIKEFLRLVADENPSSSVEVSADDHESNGKRMSHDARMAVEKTAIRYIRRKEKGWHKTPPRNEGFDLYQTKSGRANGRKTRWCEVKGLSGEFGSSHPVSLTAPEFRMAQKRGDAYWLYIVENATSSKPHLIKIKNPAGKARRFIFGRRWDRWAEGPLT